MKIRSVRLRHYKRFAHLEITDLPPSTLVMLAGPNGSGKSSLFESFNTWAQARSGRGLTWDASYHLRPLQTLSWNQCVDIVLHGDLPNEDRARRKLFYFRSAYRNDPDFKLEGLSRVPDTLDEQRFIRMIDSDAAVSRNYQRVVSQAFEDAFVREAGSVTIHEFREKILGEIRDSVRRLFPDLVLNDLGNPLSEGTFRFDKGATRGFVYKNLSGGEKAAFDLILDMVVKKRAYDDTVFCIDEPEAHMNTRLHGPLLEELFKMIPKQSQLWIATHSIGMMRKARELASSMPGEVIFLDFGAHNFDDHVVMAPTPPTRRFWEEALRVALDDLAALVAPHEVVICEGNPVKPVPGKNSEHDARCYDTIFGSTFPDVKFVSAGSSKEVASDRLGFAATLPKIAPGLKITRLIDRDDHAPPDVLEFNNSGIRVLPSMTVALRRRLHNEATARVLAAMERGGCQRRGDTTGTVPRSVVRGRARGRDGVS